MLSWEKKEEDESPLTHHNKEGKDSEVPPMRGEIERGREICPNVREMSDEIFLKKIYKIT